MPTITRKISINAAVAKVFDFVTKPENWTRYVTSLTEVKNLSSQEPAAGTTFFWTYRMFGMNFHGRGHITELVKNRKFGLKMEGSFPILESYTFTKTDDGGTELSAEITYDMPGKILGVIANKGLMEKINKKEAENVLAKVKMFCEAL